MDTDPQKHLFKRAAEIASVVPESMQEAAFQRALDMLLGEEPTSAPPRSESRGASGKRRRHSSTGSVREQADSAAILIEGIDQTKYPEVGDEPKVLERALHILRIAKDDFGLDGLSANEVASVLTDKFRIRTTRQRVNQVLDAASTLVDRGSLAGKRGARYRIMAAGEDHLAKHRDQRDDTPRQPSRRSPSKRQAPRRRSKPGGTQTTARRQRRGIGPRAALEDLLSEGYLDEPRTIGALRDRLESKKGRTFKTTDLSPALTRMLRDGTLDRERSEGGQYEYQRK